MTPTQIEEKIRQMESELSALKKWMEERKRQQLSYPVDDASKDSLGVFTEVGPGSTTLTQDISIGPGGGTASVPKAYQGTVIINAQGKRYEIPYLSTP